MEITVTCPWVHGNGATSVSQFCQNASQPVSPYNENIRIRFKMVMIPQAKNATNSPAFILI